MKSAPLTRIIKATAVENGYSGKTLAKEIGLPYPTLIYRYKYPETWRFCEFGALLRHITFTEEDLKRIEKEVRKL